jgi:hypothetical protein
MMSEHFAAHHFFKDARRAPEPVLRQILHLVAKDEVRHCQFAFDLLKSHLEEHPHQVPDVLDEALHFRHIGELVIDEMPIAQKNDFAAIVAINRKIQRLTGKTLFSNDIQCQSFTCMEIELVQAERIGRCFAAWKDGAYSRRPMACRTAYSALFRGSGAFSSMEPRDPRARLTNHSHCAQLPIVLP